MPPPIGYHGEPVNPLLSRLQPYPFERLRALFDGVTPPPLPPIRLSIGEPQHPTPALIRRGACAAPRWSLGVSDDGGTGPVARGDGGLVRARYGLPHLDPATQVLPVNGTREALFAFAQAVVDRSRPIAARRVPESRSIRSTKARRCSPAPSRLFLNQTDAQRLRARLRARSTRSSGRGRSSSTSAHRATRPGACSTLDEWRTLFALSDRHGFVIASDECYSEIYDRRRQPPLGGARGGRAARTRPTTATSSSSPACRSGRMRRACARARWRATRGC